MRGIEGMGRMERQDSSDDRLRRGAERRTSRVIPLAVVAAVVGLVLGLGLSAAGPATAQYTFSERNQKKMIKVIEAIQEDRIDDAIEELNSVNLRRARPYGRARVHQMLGTLAAQREQYEEALKHMEAAVAEEALQPEEQLRSLYLVGQLQTMLERYDEAVQTLEKWIAQVEEPAPSSYYTLAVTYYQAQRPEDAVEPARKAIEL